MGMSVINWGGIVDQKLSTKSNHPLMNRTAAEEFLKQQMVDDEIKTRLNGLVTNSNNITQPGYALDAQQNNAAIAGTLANRITNLSKPPVISTYDLLSREQPCYIHRAITDSKVHGTWVSRVGNIVTFRFIFVAIEIIPAQTLFLSLPTGFRPHLEIKFPCLTSHDTPNHCMISPSGNCYLDYEVAPGTSTTNLADSWCFLYASWICVE